MGQIPYRLVKSSKKSFLLKFNMPNIIYTLACYLFYCISVYFFIENTATYSKNFPEISLIGNYNPFISFAARSSQFLLFCRRLITFFFHFACPSKSDVRLSTCFNSFSIPIRAFHACCNWIYYITYRLHILVRQRKKSLGLC